jgi:hypothetical protein
VDRGPEGGPTRAPLASKLSVALHMGQTRGPACLLFKWAANLAYLSLLSIISPSLEYLRGILTDFPLVLDNRCGGNRGGTTRASDLPRRACELSHYPPHRVAASRAPTFSRLSRTRMASKGLRGAFEG